MNRFSSAVRNPFVVGLAVFAVVGGSLAAAYVKGKGMPDQALLMVLLTISTASFSAISAANAWRALLVGTLVGVFVGALSVFDLVRGPAFEDEFFVALATMTFFAFAGLVVGIAAECIRWLHRITHRKTGETRPN